MASSPRDSESPQNVEQPKVPSPGTDAPEISGDDALQQVDVESIEDSTLDGNSQDSPELSVNEADVSAEDSFESTQQTSPSERTPIHGGASTNFTERLFPEPQKQPATDQPGLEQEDSLEPGGTQADLSPEGVDDWSMSEVADPALDAPDGSDAYETSVDAHVVGDTAVGDTAVGDSVQDDPVEMAPPLPETRVGGATPSAARERSAKERLLHSARPRFTRAQILTALLLGLLGFMLVAQLQLSQKDELTGLRQSELISLLDEVTRRTDDLEAEESRLNSLLDELQSGQNTQEIAKEAAEENAEVQGILSGRLPATGPGVMIEIQEGETPLRPQVLFNVLEELRNAGSEAVEVNGVRLVASSYFSELDGDIAVNGQVLQAPYVWYAIGDPATIQPALEIPGGAMPSVRSGSGSATVTAMDEVTVSAVVNVREPEFAKPDTGDN